MSTGARQSGDAELLRTLMDRIDQTDAGAFNNLGVLLHSKGLLRESVDAFFRALDLDPRMRTASANLEIAAAVPAACDTLLGEIDAALAEHPGDRSVLLRKARVLRMIGRAADGAAILDALIASDPDDATALFERGLVEQRLGDLRRALLLLERAASAAPDDAMCQLHLAEVLYHRGQNEQSLRILDALTAQWPDLAEAHLLRGFVLGDVGRHEDGIVSARRAAALDPSLQSLHANLSITTAPASPAENERTAAHRPEPGDLCVRAGSSLASYGLGLAFRQRGYFAEARREFERAIQQDDGREPARQAILELDLIAGEHVRATAGYAALTDAEPDNARWWNELGIARHQSGDVDGAANEYRRALRADPRYAYAYNNLGVAHADAGNAVAARDAFLHAATLDSGLFMARTNLALAHAQAGELSTAHGILRELVAFNPSHADGWHGLGRVLQGLQRAGEARDAYMRAIGEQPTHAEARYGLAEVLLTLGDEDGALRETQYALRLSPVRTPPRLRVVMALHAECPDALSAIDLLSLRNGDAPLAGVALDDAHVAALLPSDAALAVEEVARTAEESVRLQQRECALAADRFARRGLHGEALERYRNVRQALDDAPPDAHRDRLWRAAALGEARCLCMLGRGADALGLLRHVGATSARDAEMLSLFAFSAATASRAGECDAEAARAALRRVLRLDTSSAPLLHFCGDAAMLIDDSTLAMACYRRALAVDPTRPSARVAIAQLLRQRGDLLAARLELVAALAVNPTLPEAQRELARVHALANRPGDALLVLTTLLAAVPTDIVAIVQLAELLIAMERDEDARIAIDRALRHDAEHGGASWFDGVLHARRGHLRLAHARWRKVVALQSDGEFRTRALRALAERVNADVMESVAA